MSKADDIFQRSQGTVGKVRPDLTVVKRPEYPPASLPMDVAEKLVTDLFTIDGKKTLATWRGDMWLRSGTHWQLAKDTSMVTDKLWQQLGKAITAGDGEDTKAWAPTKARVENVLEPLKVLTRIDGNRDAPMWLSNDEYPPADGLIPMSNGLLDMKTRELIPHTPDLFNTYALNYDYDPAAKCPNWLQFLDSILDHDPGAKLFLQEYVGYIVSGEKKYDKAALILGPKRAGKGVIARTLGKLIGEVNTATPTLHSLGSESGLSTLIGKPLAMITDMRAGAPNTSHLAVERLLNIVGNDPVQINRKLRDYWEGKLPTRFLCFSNETPRFLDSSGAIASRFIGVKLKQSFFGMEDTGLEGRISSELSGIFNWALQGLDALEEQGGCQMVCV